MTRWHVICEPRTEGILVQIQAAGAGFAHEVARVAYDRKSSRSPDVEFSARLEQVVDQAEKACEIVNAYIDEQADLQRQSAERAKQAIREILGKPSRSAKPE